MRDQDLVWPLCLRWRNGARSRGCLLRLTQPASQKKNQHEHHKKQSHCGPLISCASKLHFRIFIFLSHLSTSFCASSALAPVITRYCPSLSDPPLVVKPCTTVLCGHSSVTV